MEIVSAIWATDGGNDSISIAITIIVVLLSINICIGSHLNILNAVHDHVVTCSPLQTHCYWCLFYRCTVTSAINNLIFVVVFSGRSVLCSTSLHSLLFDVTGLVVS